MAEKTREQVLEAALRDLAGRAQGDPEGEYPSLANFMSKAAQMVLDSAPAPPAWTREPKESDYYWYRPSVYVDAEIVAVYEAPAFEPPGKRVRTFRGRDDRAEDFGGAGRVRWPACRAARAGGRRMSEETWTEERVRAAYAEWKQLSNRAEDVVHAMQRAQGQDEGYYEGLVLPDWYGTDWPGREGYLGDSAASDGLHRFPLEWLWTAPACVEEAKAKHVEWLKTREAEIEEKKERAELKRLQAKFAPPASGEGGPADG